MFQDSCEKTVQNDVILRNISSFLKVEELKAFRGVCKKWKEASKFDFRENSSVTLIDPVHRFSSEDSEREVDAFLRRFESIPNRFRHYGILVFDSGKMPFWNNLFRKYGGQMESLRLYWSHEIMNLNAINKIFSDHISNLKNLVLTCPDWEDCPEGLGTLAENRNLKSLEFNGEFDINYEEYQSFEMQWIKFFEAFPNLKALILGNVNDVDISIILEAAMTVKAQAPNTLKLEELCLFGGDPYYFEFSPAMKKVVALKLVLKSLSLDIGKDCDESSLKALLIQQRNNLEMMELIRHPEGIPIQNFGFGIHFNSLTDLSIQGSVGQKLTFLLKMPALRSLRIYKPFGEEGEYQVIRNTNADEIKPLQHLTTIQIDGKISLDCQQKVVKWFPSVKRAKLHLNNEGFRFICGCWVQLEELEVFGNELTSEGILGDMNVVERERRNILCFKNLRKFVYINFVSLNNALDDNSVENGFLKMERLTNLEIFPSNISDAAAKKLYDSETIIKLRLNLNGKFEKPKIIEY